MSTRTTSPFNLIAAVGRARRPGAETLTKTDGAEDMAVASEDQTSAAPAKPLSFRIQLENALAEHGALESRRLELGDQVTQLQRTFDSAVIDAATGDATAREHAHALHREITDAKVDAYGVDLALKRVAARISELTPKRQAEADAEARAQYFDRIDAIERDVDAAISDFFTAVDSLVVAFNRVDDGRRQLAHKDLRDACDERGTLARLQAKLDSERHLFIHGKDGKSDRSGAIRWTLWADLFQKGLGRGERR